MSEQSWVLVQCLFWAVVIFGVLNSWSQKKPSREQAVRMARLEAKVDALMNHAGLQYDDPFKHVPDAVLQAIQHGQKIEAIKLYRDTTAVGLKEAKDFVENVARRLDEG